MIRITGAVLAAFVVWVTIHAASAQTIPAFPGAEGAGAAALGGRGGDLYFVTSLADTNTPGTLRYGLTSAPTTGRTILFRTGGTIYLQSTLNIAKPKITIAGQSAPGDGITLAYRQTQVSGVNDVVLRNLRFRPGNSVTLASGTTSPYEPDALHVEGVRDVMIDHVSASWSVDEVLSVTNSTEVTVQWSAVTEALNNAGHSKGAHGYGALVSGDQISYHHNYFAHNNSRNPRPGLSVSGNYVTGTINFDYRNNVTYNWGGENGYNGSEAGVMNMNYVGNYSVAGPSTTASKTGRAFLVGLTDTRLYLAGNKIDADRDLLRDGTDTGWSMIATSTATNPTKPSSPVGNTSFVSTQTADAAYASVLAHGGARYWGRDSIDTRVFGEPATQGGRIIDSGTQVGGYPTLASGTAPTDTDSDGMPDAWEASLGLNPLVKNNNADYDADGYTDLEEYLNELAAWPAPLPAVFSGTSTRFAAWSNWDTKWQPSRFDTVQINSGTAVVDAIGQDAGTIQLGAAVVAGQAPTLSITSGGLRVMNSLVVGSATGASARVGVSGGKLTVGGTITTGSATSGVFTFTGGTVAAFAIDATKLRPTPTGTAGTFRVAGGAAVLAPGDTNSSGRMTVTGGLALDTGSLVVELGGTAAASTFRSATAAHDVLAASGTVSLGGGLSLSVTGSYAPAWLVPHTILTGRAVQGTFASTAGIDIGGNKRLAVTYTATSAVVAAAAPGDTNVDGVLDILDAASFIAAGLFDTGRTTAWEQGDFNGDGVLDVLDAADFQMLGLFDAGTYAAGPLGQAAAFGDSGGIVVAPVPEPGTTVLMAMGLAIVCLIGRLSAGGVSEAQPEPIAAIEAPFSMPQLQRPVFASRVVSIADHGAVAGGTVKNTAAIRATIAEVAKAGGGRVLVPAGVWLTGPIHLESGIDLHLADGAVLTFSDSMDDYLPPVFVRSGGIELWNYSPLVYARDCTNVAITGGGRLDGNARAWWSWAKKETRRGFEMGADGVPVAERIFGTPEAAIRPSFVGLVNCTNVLLEGFTIGGGPNWTIHPIYCENVIIRRVTVATDGPNNDGIDPDSCRNVLIEHCVFDTGDDCVVLKSGYDQDGRRVGRPTENVVMRHCTAKRGHGGLVIGSEMSGSVRNVFMHDCDFVGTDRVLRIKSRPGRGGVVERVWVEDVTARDLQREVVILNMDYTADRNPVTDTHPPRFRDIHVRRVAAVGAPVAIRIVGMESSPIESVTFSDLAIVSQAGIVAKQARGVSFERVSITPTKGPLWDLESTEGFTLDGTAVTP